MPIGVAIVFATLRCAEVSAPSLDAADEEVSLPQFTYLAQLFRPCRRLKKYLEIKSRDSKQRFHSLP
ncbi:MAG TPA: hypothetical protein VMD30_06405 [Tepidisphaeraceae bacterium]|nr:hypothetical protein [Tepidisphaeraceae bacterium]